MALFTEEEKTLLRQYVTSAESNVFAIKGLPGIVGAIYARYSRAGTGFRETLLKEFIKEGIVDSAHAQDLIERILVAYGDDSVGELEGAHVSFENVSALGEKAVVDHRIGSAFIVQSTRYVFFDEKGDDGNFKYYRDPRIMASPLADEYIRVMDLCFQTYADLVKPLVKYLRTQKPIADAEYDINGNGVKEKFADLTDPNDVSAFKRTYKFDIRSKACDTVRVLLPLSIKTNLGVYGNGRFYQQMLSTFYTSDLTELQEMARDGQAALNDVIPRYVKRAKRSEYIVEIENSMQKLMNRLFGHIKPEAAEEIELLARPKTEAEFELSLTTAIAYEYSHLPFRQLQHVISELPPEMVQLIRATYIGKRETRRDRPGRALEFGYPYAFDLLVPFHVFKDLQRHRMANQLWQKFTPHLGFQVPPELAIIGATDRLIACEKEARELYEKLRAAGFEKEAQYAVLYGHSVRWVFSANDRALMHMLELRSTPQGHPSYRRIAQLMHKKIHELSAWRGDAMKFVDYNDYYWSRADSEARQRVKEKELEEKLAKEKASI